jgi:GNAT superfamily N-acetyltransferase
MGARMHEESPDYTDFAFIPAKLMDLADMVLGMDSLHCVVAENHHGLTGFFVGGVEPFFFSHDLYAYDIAFYVRPECRGSSAAVRLLNHFMAWGKAKGAKQARFGAATGINPEQAHKFFTHLGFREGGVLYTTAL